MDELVKAGVAAAEQQIVGAGPVGEIMMRDGVGDQRHHGPRPRRNAPELVTDLEMAAVHDARARLPEFLPRMVRVEGDEIGDLRTFMAAYAQDFALRDSKSTARARGNLGGAHAPA